MSQTEPESPIEATSVFAGGLLPIEPGEVGHESPAEGAAGAADAAGPGVASRSGASAEVGAEQGIGGIEGVGAGTALLVVKRGPNAGSRFALESDVVTVGRHPDSEIYLDDISVSRRHAEFRRIPGGFSVTDVGSLNGTYLNREMTDSATLSSGDEIQIGKFRLVYLAAPGTDDTTSVEGAAAGR